MSSSPSRVLRAVNLELVGSPILEPVMRVPRVLRQASVTTLETQVRPPEPGGESLHHPAYDEGFEAGRESARQQLMSAANAIADALQTCRQNLREEFERQQTEMVQITVGLTEFVLGHAGHDGGEVLLGRLSEVLALLDDQDLVIAMCDVDMALAEQIEAPGLVVVVDPDLQPGEARVTGEWARADLTRSKALELLAEDGIA